MASPVRGKLWPLALLALAYVGIGRIAWDHVQGHVQAIDLLRTVPPGDLAAPKAGPAVYKGKLYGPTGRKEPKGATVAAHWWWVDKKVGKNNWKTVCFQRDVGGLRLVDGKGVTAPLPVFDTEKSYALAGTNWSDDYVDRVIVDFGYDSPIYERDKPPPGAEKCWSSGYVWIGRSLPQGAPVEVLACAKDGVLEPCPGMPGMIVARNGVAVHRGRRVSDAQTPFMALSIVTLVLSTLYAVYAMVTRSRVLKVASTKGDA